MTPERAQEIIDIRPPFGNYIQHCTAEEYQAVLRVWRRMPGHTCWYDALLRIARGEEEAS